VAEGESGVMGGQICATIPKLRNLMNYPITAATMAVGGREGNYDLDFFNLTHGIAAEDHPLIENGELAHGPVKLARFDGQLLLASRARQFEPGSNFLPEVIR
jgi:hypothetical protein